MDSCLSALDYLFQLITAQLFAWISTAWSWQRLADASQWLLSLGLLTTIVGAILTSHRERLSRERDRRSQLAKAFLDACATALAARLNGTASSDDRSDADLVFAHQMLMAANTGPNAARFNSWTAEVVRDVRFGQPPPTLEQTVALLASTIAAWVQDPAKGNPPGE